jgi:hypothetical protein
MTNGSAPELSPTRHPGCPYHDRSAPHGVVDGLPQATNGTRRMRAPTCACGGSCLCHVLPPVPGRCHHCPEDTTSHRGAHRG